MDTTATMDSTTPRFNALLPFWAVFQADALQTLASWLYRLWALLLFLAVGGYLMYRFGVLQHAGMATPAPGMIADLMQWLVFGSITLIIALTAGAICSERGSIADSVLSRGISRNGYYLGKLSSRLAVVLGTLLVFALIAITGAVFLLRSDEITLLGSLAALAIVASLLTCVVTSAVSISSLSSNTVFSVAVVWFGLYGVGFALSLVPEQYPNPERILRQLPMILKDQFNSEVIRRFVLGCLALSGIFTVIGMVGFSRSDV